METILHLLPLSPAQQDCFRSAAPHEEHLFLPTSDRRGAADIPQDWRERATILMGFVPPADLKTFPRLKWVQSWNAGVDPYLVPGVLPEGVVLTCAAGAYGPAVSEHLLAMLLALYKRLPAYRDQQNAHTWADLGHVRSLRGETVLVGGTGDIGRHFAHLCRALGAKTVMGSTAPIPRRRALTGLSPCLRSTLCSPRPTWWLWPFLTTPVPPVLWTAAACC